MGKRYTEEEKRQIQELAQEGHTDESIAQQLSRSTNAIRNIRYRNKIKTREKETIQKLKEEKQNLIKQTQELNQRLTRLNRRRDKLRTAVQVDDQTLKKKIETELRAHPTGTST